MHFTSLNEVKGVEECEAPVLFIRDSVLGGAFGKNLIICCICAATVSDYCT